ncbi:MAG TPA: glycosyltransferase, partial [Firmicutes bacterium]|nr:glycosyltransferase [Bacillota bacterium]
MSGSYLYLVAVAIYLVFFGLFIRFFIWKRYADRCYWNRRPLLDVAKVREEAVRRGKEVPRFSILIPARNEADVIARTVDHMCRLQYPADRYEVVVVTDQKERLAREEVRPRLVAEAVSSLGGRGTAPALGEAEAAASGAQAAGGRARPVGSRAQASMLALGLLTRCGQAHWQPGSRLSRTLGWVPGTRLPAEAERNLVRELAWHIVHHRGKVSPGRLLFLVRRAYNGSPVEWARRAYPCYLAASLPVVVAYLHLLRQPIRPVLSRLARKVLPLPAATSRQVVLALSGAVARHIVREVVRLRRAGALAAALDEVFPESFPTTQDVVQASLRKLAGGARQPGRPRADCP